MLKYTRSRSRRFERQRLIQEAQLSEADGGSEMPAPRRPSKPVGGDEWVPDPDALPAPETVIREFAWMGG